MQSNSHIVFNTLAHSVKKVINCFVLDIITYPQMLGSTQPGSTLEAFSGQTHPSLKNENKHFSAINKEPKYKYTSPHYSPYCCTGQCSTSQQDNSMLRQYKYDNTLLARLGCHSAQQKQHHHQLILTAHNWAEYTCFNEIKHT